MSYGGGESEGVREKLVSRNTSKKSNSFAHEVAKVSVAQICESVGFQSFQLSALEALSDVAIYYLHSIAKSSATYANRAGRSQANAFDVIQSLEELSSSQGFAFASNVDHCLSTSGTVKEIAQYASDTDNAPFAHPIPSFPVVRERAGVPSFLEAGKEPPGEHIPSWLPPFPDPQTLFQSNCAVTGCKELRKPNAIDTYSLKPSTVPQCNGYGFLSAADYLKGKEFMETNPFLAAPLPCRARDDSTSHLDDAPPDFPRENSENNLPKLDLLSAVEEFPPANDAVRNSPSNSDDGNMKVLLHQRPTVNFKFTVERKTFANIFEENDEKLHHSERVKNDPWSATYDEKDQKKLRAERILTHSVENFGELA